MNKSTHITILISILVILLAGCTKTQSALKPIEITDLDSSETNESSESSETIDATEIGFFSFGPSEAAEKHYIYDGNPIRIPFQIAGFSEAISDFGVFVLVNGEPQAYTIEYEDGTILSESHMHKFKLKKDSVMPFVIEFSPKTGNSGETVGIQFATILTPDYRPDLSSLNANYGIFHSLSKTLPISLYFEKDAQAVENMIKPSTFDVNDAYYSTLNVKGQYYNFTPGEMTPVLYQVDGDPFIFKVHEDRLNFNLDVIGGQSGVNYRTTLFLNHKPIKIDGQDYIDVTAKEGIGSRVTLEIPTSDVAHLDTLYALTVPYGEDYKVSNAFPVKSQSGTVFIDASEVSLTTVKYLPKDFLFGIYSYDKDAFISQLSLKKIELMLHFGRINQGAFAVVYTADAPIPISETGHLKYPSNIIRKELHIYDQQLKLIKKVELTETFTNFDLESLFWNIGVSENGRYLAISEAHQLNVYDMQTEKFLYQLDDDTIFFGLVSIDDDGQYLVYTSNANDTNDTFKLSMVSLDNHSEAHFKYSAYENPSKIFIAESYAWVCDAVDGFTKKTSGTIPIIDLKTRTSELKQVDSLESACAYIDEEAGQIVAVHPNIDGKIRVRLYDVTNMEVLDQVTLEAKSAQYTLLELIYDEKLSRYSVAISLLDETSQLFNFTIVGGQINGITR